MAQIKLTLAQVAVLDCSMLTPAQAAGVMGCSPYKINVASRTQEGREFLGFPVLRVGNRVKIPRIPFLRHMGWEGKINGANDAPAQ